MWLLEWLIARWGRVWLVLEDRYPKLTNLIVAWYFQAEWVLSTGYSKVTDVAYYWRNKIKNVAVDWYNQAAWVLNTGYSLITDVAYYWREKISNLVNAWYDRLQNLASNWYGFFTTLWERRDDILYLAITAIGRIKSVFSGLNWDRLIAFLVNPGAVVWAYIIGLAEDKLEELLDTYW